MKKRGRLAKPIDPETKDKMITLRMSGELYNAIVRAAGLRATSLNAFILDTLTKQELINIAMQWIRREKQNASTDTSTTSPIHSERPPTL